MKNTRAEVGKGNCPKPGLKNSTQVAIVAFSTSLCARHTCCCCCKGGEAGIYRVFAPAGRNSKNISEPIKVIIIFREQRSIEEEGRVDETFREFSRVHA